MTNEQIIFNERVRLMNENKIGSTGRSIVVETIHGKKIQMFEPEEIHTFQAWKALGSFARVARPKCRARRTSAPDFPEQ